MLIFHILNRHAQVENLAHRLITNVKIRHIINARDYGKPKKKGLQKLKNKKRHIFITIRHIVSLSGIHRRTIKAITVSFERASYRKTVTH